MLASCFCETSGFSGRIGGSQAFLLARELEDTVGLRRRRWRVEEALIASRRGRRRRDGVVVDAVVGGDDEARVVPRPLHPLLHLAPLPRAPVVVPA